MVEALLRGALLGLATCLTFGPVTIAVMKAGLDRRAAAALLCGTGAALVDAAESQLAYLGVAEILGARPGAIALLYLLAGVVLLVSGLRAARSAPVATAADVAGGARAFVQGVVMTALNPAPLLGWVALAGSLFADLDRTQALVASGGVGAGVLVWFVGVTGLALRGGSLLGPRARIVTRALDLVLAGAGVYLIARGALLALR